MTWWKTAALTVAVLGAAGLGAYYAPVASAQTRTVPPAVTARADALSTVGGSRIGMSIRDLAADELKGTTTSGAIVESVEDDSPAAEAGLKAGDIIVEFDGERVRSMRQLARLVSETPDGRTVAAAVLRDGQRVTVNVTPQSSNAGRLFEHGTWEPLERLREFEGIVPPARPAPAPRAPRPPSFERFAYRPGHQLGVTVNELPSQLAEYFGTRDGVLVASVTENSAAAKAGVKAGDVITSVNGSAVDSASELRRRVRALDNGEEFSLGIVRDRKAITVKGKLERPAERRRTARTIL